jgi:hypothetical protein
VAWGVEGKDEFADWFEALTDDEQVSVGRVVELLREWTVAPIPVFVGRLDLPAPPHARTQDSTRGAAVPCAVCHPRRAGIVLFGGDKTDRTVVMTNTFRLLTSSTTNTSGNWNEKG